MSKRTRQELRLKLFDHYSGLLGEARPEHAGLYGCPICLNGYPRSAAELTPGTTVSELTLEDVIPKGLGKQWLVLTCRNCNNTLGGRALDSHLHDQIKFSQFLSGDGETKINATMSIGEHRMAIKYGRRTEDGQTHSSLDARPRGNNPAAAEAIEQKLKSASPENFPNVKLTFPIPNDRRAAISQLKIGYLSAFMLFGYEYILTERLDLIREQIAKPSEKLIEVESLVVSVPDPCMENTIIIAREPADLEAIGVAFTLKKPIHGARHRAVILPSDASPPDFFEKMAQLRASGVQLRLTGESYPIARPTLGG